MRPGTRAHSLGGHTPPTYLLLAGLLPYLYSYLPPQSMTFTLSAAGDGAPPEQMLAFLRLQQLAGAWRPRGSVTSAGGHACGRHDGIRIPLRCAPTTTTAEGAIHPNHPHLHCTPAPHHIAQQLWLRCLLGERAATATAPWLSLRGKSGGRGAVSELPCKRALWLWRGASWHTPAPAPVPAAGDAFLLESVFRPDVWGFMMEPVRQSSFLSGPGRAGPGPCMHACHDGGQGRAGAAGRE